MRGVNGAQLLAVGVAEGEGGEPVNVICTVGDAAGASAREQALRAAVDPATVDPVTNLPVGEQVERATVTASTDRDLAGARAELSSLPTHRRATSSTACSARAMRRGSAVRFSGVPGTEPPPPPTGREPPGDAVPDGTTRGRQPPSPLTSSDMQPMRARSATFLALAALLAGAVLPGGASAARIPTVDVTPKLAPGPSYDFHTAGGRIQCDLVVGAHGTAVDCAGPTKSASLLWSGLVTCRPAWRTRRARAGWCVPARGCASTCRPTGSSTAAGPSARRCSASTRARATGSSWDSPSPAASDGHAAEGRHRPTAADHPWQRVAGGGPRGGKGPPPAALGRGMEGEGKALGPCLARQARRRVGRRRRGQTHSRAGRVSSQASASRVNARAVFAWSSIATSL